jgi:hypothetical protein
MLKLLEAGPSAAAALLEDVTAGAEVVVTADAEPPNAVVVAKLLFVVLVPFSKST